MPIFDALDYYGLSVQYRGRLSKSHAYWLAIDGENNTPHGWAVYRFDRCSLLDAGRVLIPRPGSTAADIDRMIDKDGDRGIAIAMHYPYSLGSRVSRWVLNDTHSRGYKGRYGMLIDSDKVIDSYSGRSLLTCLGIADTLIRRYPYMNYQFRICAE